MTFGNCSICNKQGRIWAKGKCQSCYIKDYVNNHPEYKERKKIASKKWADKNKGYWKKYAQKKKENKLMENKND